jgi:hypothetical protein
MQVFKNLFLLFRPSNYTPLCLALLMIKGVVPIFPYGCSWDITTIRNCRFQNIMHHDQFMDGACEIYEGMHGKQWVANSVWMSYYQQLVFDFLSHLWPLSWVHTQTSFCCFSCVSYELGGSVRLLLMNIVPVKSLLSSELCTVNCGMDLSNSSTYYLIRTSRTWMPSRTDPHGWP